MDDLSVAIVLMMVGGQLVLLRPRKVRFYEILTQQIINFTFQSGSQEVNYDMQIFAERIEFCWIHLRGVGALENSLWGYDGQNIRVWLNALAIESSASADEPSSVKESASIPLDFYPLCMYIFLVSLGSCRILMVEQLFSWTRESSLARSTRLRRE